MLPTVLVTALCLGQTGTSPRISATPATMNPPGTAWASDWVSQAGLLQEQLPPPTFPPSEQKDASQKKDVATSETAEPKEPKSGENGFADFIKPKREEGGCLFRLYKAYYDQFFPAKNGEAEEEEERPRRALPSPWDAPPFPSSEYQGYPGGAAI